MNQWPWFFSNSPRFFSNPPRFSQTRLHPAASLMPRHTGFCATPCLRLLRLQSGSSADGATSLLYPLESYADRMLAMPHIIRIRYAYLVAGAHEPLVSKRATAAIVVATFLKSPPIAHRVPWYFFKAACSCRPLVQATSWLPLLPSVCPSCNAVDPQMKELYLLSQWHVLPRNWQELIPPGIKTAVIAIAEESFMMSSEPKET